MESEARKDMGVDSSSVVVPGLSRSDDLVEVVTLKPNDLSRTSLCLAWVLAIQMQGQ